MSEALIAIGLGLAVILFAKPLVMLLLFLVTNPVLLVIAIVACFAIGIFK